MVIVGSTALAYWGIRKAKDLDVWGTEDEAAIYAGTDFSVMPWEVLRLIPKLEAFATIDALYTIKVSHLGWDIFWWKHVNDVLTLQAKGAKLLPTLFNALVDHWKKAHGNKDFLSLYKDKTAFFNDYVTYVYDHDYLHELVAFPNAPMYTKCLKDGEQVAIDFLKFRDELTFEEKVRMFREEISAIAIERWLVNPATCGKIDWQTAYHYALRKTVCYLTKNWATTFLVTHLKEFIKPDYKYFAHAMTTLREGKTIMANRISSEEAKRIFGELITRFNTKAKYPIETPRGLTPDVIGEALDCMSSTEGFKVVASYGGEGMGERAYTVFEFDKQLYKLSYCYYSHEGNQLDDWENSLYAVEAKPKTIMVYE